MELRVAQKNDLEDIVELRFENAIYHSTIMGSANLKPEAKNFFRDHTQRVFEDDNAKILVVSKDKVLLGYVIGFINQQHPIFDFGKQGLIDDVYIQTQNQREGYGRMLVAELFQWFSEQQVKRVELNVYQTNAIGVQFWEKVGFESYFQRMFKEIK